ncbi:MAG TPA: sulfotransferase, partial [Actinomycetota bacterium]|nr:sulfotransferase [Actinomycetota bacterium]
MPDQRPFFIVACARSGTTLLRTILNRHPDVVVTPESHFITELWQRRRRYGPRGRVVQLHRFVDDLQASRRYRLWDLPADLLHEEVGRLEGPAPSFADVVTAPFRAYARWKGKPRWGDKTPAYVEHIPLLASLFPDARFVH